MRWLWIALVALIGCKEVVYDGTLDPNHLPPDQAGYQQGRDGAIEAAEIATRAGCARLWSDCNSRCMDDFVYCGGSEDQCVHDYAKNAVEDLIYPVYSTELAEKCAQQLEERSCIDLDPDSPECEAAVLEGCPNDQDGYGAPYSWLSAAPIEMLPATLRPHLCSGADEWFAIHLEAGELAQLGVVGGTGQAWVGLYQPVGVPGRMDVEDVGHDVHVDPASTFQETQSFIAAPVTGTYYLKFSLNQVSVGDLNVVVGTDRRAPPTVEELARDAERIVYSALCARLHNDCASTCASTDVFCGATVDECSNAFAASAVEVLFDHGGRTIDRAKAEACAQDLSQRACSELGAMNAVCGDLLVNQCPADASGFLRPVAGRMARTIALPAALDLQLCDGIPQFFRIDLAQNAKLTMRTDVAPAFGSAYANLFAPAATDEDLAGNSNYLFFSYYLSPDPTTTDALPLSGSYYLRVEYNGTGPLHLSISE